MEVYKDILSGTEYFSNAKAIKPVVEGKEEEKVDGLVFVATHKQAAGGESVDIGCGNAFGGEAEEEVDDTVETKIDQLLAFPDIQEENIPFTSFKQFRDEYFKGYMKTLMKFKKARGDFKTKDDMTAFQTQMKGIMAWLKANFSNIDFYQAAAPTSEVEIDGETKEVATSLVYGHWADGVATPNFCYIMAGYDMVKY